MPPLVTGDVPTADQDHLEWYLGARYEKTNGVGRQVPFTELVFGLTSFLEVTFEIPYLSVDGQTGFGDAVLGTKAQLLREEEGRPGVAASFEWKLKNGSQSQGLGTGAFEYQLRLRSQKTFAWFTGIVNLAYTLVGEPQLVGVDQPRRNVLFAAFAQEYQLASGTSLLSEIYWSNGDEPGAPSRLAGSVGFKHRVFENLSVHASVGKSLRADDLGGPKLTAYGGIKLELAVPGLNRG